MRGSGGTPALGTNCPTPSQCDPPQVPTPEVHILPKPTPTHLEDKRRRRRPGRLWAEPWPGGLRWGSWLTMTNLIQVASVKRGVSHEALGCPRKPKAGNAAPGEGLGPGAGEPAGGAPLCVSAFHSSSWSTWPRGKAWLPPAPTAESRVGPAQSPLCRLFILNSLIFQGREADWSRLG